MLLRRYTSLDIRAAHETHLRQAQDQVTGTRYRHGQDFALLDKVMPLFTVMCTVSSVKAATNSRTGDDSQSYDTPRAGVVLLRHSPPWWRCFMTFADNRSASNQHNHSPYK